MKMGLHWLQAAAGQGHAQAQCDLSTYYSHGFDVVERNAHLSAMWFTRAAEQGLPAAAMAEGRYCATGFSGRALNATRARKFFEAARRGGVRGVDAEIAKLPS
jgi:TPR repeat protein